MIFAWIAHHCPSINLDRLTLQGVLDTLLAIQRILRLKNPDAAHDHRAEVEEFVQRKNAHV